MCCCSFTQIVYFLHTIFDFCSELGIVRMSHLNFCSRFIFRSIFFCFFSSNSGDCSLRWLNHGCIIERHSMKNARAGASSNRNQNQFDISENTWVADVKMIRSLIFLKSINRNWKLEIVRTICFFFFLVSLVWLTYSAMPPSILRSLPLSSTEPLSLSFGLDINAMNWYEPSIIKMEINAIVCMWWIKAKGINVYCFGIRRLQTFCWTYWSCYSELEKKKIHDKKYCRWSSCHVLIKFQSSSIFLYNLLGALRALLPFLYLWRIYKHQ